MKQLGYTLILICLASCSGGGGGSGGGGATASPQTNGWQSYSIENIASLPTCSTDISGRLYYIEDSQTFQVCKSTGWQTITLRNKLIS